MRIIKTTGKERAERQGSVLKTLMSVFDVEKGDCLDYACACLQHEYDLGAKKEELSLLFLLRQEKGRAGELYSYGIPHVFPVIQGLLIDSTERIKRVQDVYEACSILDNYDQLNGLISEGNSVRHYLERLEFNPEKKAFYESIKRLLDKNRTCQIRGVMLEEKGKTYSRGKGHVQPFLQEKNIAKIEKEIAAKTKEETTKKENKVSFLR